MTIKKQIYGHCKKCQKERIREPFQSGGGSYGDWVWLIYCPHCHDLSSVQVDTTGAPPSETEIEETIKKYRAWI
jgi:hypothetical protein